MIPTLTEWSSLISHEEERENCMLPVSNGIIAATDGMAFL